MFPIKAVVLGLAASTMAATTIRIDVGQNGLSFTPNTVTAAVGDILEYHFHPPMHSVVQGDFGSPCQPAKSGGFYSGFVTVSSGEAPDVFQVVVNSTDPMFFYCSQNTGSHCANGMSGVVNGNSSQTLATYQSNAKSVSTANSPPAPFGGSMVAPSSSGSGSSPPATSSTGSACVPAQTKGTTSGSGYRRRAAADPCTSSPAPAPAAPNAAAQSAVPVLVVMGLAGFISMLMM